jgi:hypothetical protein
MSVETSACCAATSKTAGLAAADYPARHSATCWPRGINQSVHECSEVFCLVALGRTDPRHALVCFDNEESPMEASEHDRGLSRWSPGRKGFHGNRSRRNAKSLVVRHHFCSRSRSTCAAADESAMMSLASGMMTMRRTVKLAEESEESMRIRDNGATCMRTRILPFSPPRPRPRNQNKIAATTGERERNSWLRGTSFSSRSVTSSRGCTHEELSS